MSEKKEDKVVDLTVPTSGVIGVDCGTMNIICARQVKSGEIETESMRNVYLPIDKAEIGTMDLSQMAYVESEDTIFIIGEDAYRYANIFGSPVKRPMQKGLISIQDVDSLDVLTMMIGKLVGQVDSGTCIFSVPANSIDKNNDIIYHTNVYKRIFTQLGYQAKELNEAMAVIYSECSEDQFTGLAFSFGAGMCLHGDTEVILANGTTKTMKELSDHGRSNEFWVLSCDKDGNIVPAKAYNAHKTKNDEVIRVWLDNDQYVDCTKEHPFMLRNGSYKMAKDLDIGDSLMPCYISHAKYDNRTGYYNIRDNNSGKLRALHRLLYENYYGLKLNETNIIHHLDFNPSNNEPSNLVITNQHDHIKFHQPGIDWIRDNLKGKTYEECFGEERAKEIKDKQSSTHKQIDNDGRFQPGCTPINKGKTYDQLLGKERSDRLKSDISTTVRNNPEARKPKKKRETRICECGCKRSFEVIYTSPRRFFKASCSNIGRTRNHSEETRKKISESLKARHMEYNHKVKKIEYLNIETDVYDITVPGYHNFALKSGVFVHNSNAAMSFKGNPVLKISVARGGDWIDESVANQFGTVPNRITSIKENNTDLSDFKAGKKKERIIREAIVYYYRDLIRYALNALKNNINNELSDVDLPDSIPIVVSGGTSKATGFLELFKEIVENDEDIPFDIKSIRYADDQLTAVAEGCLIKALSEVE